MTYTVHELMVNMTLTVRVYTSVAYKHITSLCLIKTFVIITQPITTCTLSLTF